MSQSMKVQLPYLKKHAIAPKIPRLKLQDEFACRGWNNCSSPFQTNPDEGECDITASPTKYPFLEKSRVLEKCSKKKPMLLEISNIESVFLQNKQNPSKTNYVRRLSESFYDFAPKLTKQEKLNVICQRKRTQNFHKTSQNKKHCNEVSKKTGICNFLNVDNSFIKENAPEIKSCNDSHVRQTISDFLDRVKSNDVCTVKYIDSKKSDSGRLVSKLDVFQKVPNESLPFMTLKSEQDKILRTDVSNSDTYSSSFLYNKNIDSFSPAKNKDICTVTNGIQERKTVEKNHCDSSVNINDTKIIHDDLKLDSWKTISPSVISDSPLCIQDESSSDSYISSVVPCSPVCSEKCNLNKTENFLPDSVKTVPTTLTSNSPISIHDENSPESPLSPIILCSPDQPCDDSKNKKLSIHRKNYSDSLMLQDFQDTFQIRALEESLISDYSPTKEKNIKPDISLNITNKFKTLSEAFVNTPSSAGLINNDCCVPSAKSDHNPVNIDFKNVLSIIKNDLSFKDSFVNDYEVSEANSMTVNNKAFLKRIQSSFQENLSSGDKGSSWVQTLNWDQFSQSKDVKNECNDQIVKKNFRNIIHGGFAEQIFKVQRRERSDKVIWNHKMNELKKKAAANMVTFALTSILHVGKIVVTKSTTTDIDNEYIKDFFSKAESNTDMAINNDPSHNKSSPHQSKTFIVLFEREIFTKMHLKVGDDFSLYPPWQFLSVPSLPFPVILCAYFVEAINKYDESVSNCNQLSIVQAYPVLYKSLHEKSCECDESVLTSHSLCNSSDLYGKTVCVSARVQRVWKTAVAVNKHQNVLKIDYNFSFLLQIQDRAFLEFKINSNQLPDAYLEFLSHAEGKCLKFCDVIISHRYNLPKSHQLKSFLQHIRSNSSGDEALCIQQLYCYQLIPASFNKIPCDIPEEKFPVYCNYEVQPLSFLQKNDQRDMRICCIGKIIFQNNENFYITDESLLCSKVKKYCLLRFENILKEMKDSLAGAIVLIKEAVYDKDYIFVDKFSSCKILSCSKDNKLSYESRIKKIGLITYEHVLSSLSLSSKVREIVLVKGIISQVDDSTAISWLECSFCSGENLLEDSNSVIYCEDCACIDPKPVLKVKMEVIVQDTYLPTAKVKIQLLSSTIKKILKISEDNYQPECNISDVLKKSTGVLCCYLRDIDMTDKLTIFHLTEIKRC